MSWKNISIRSKLILFTGVTLLSFGFGLPFTLHGFYQLGKSAEALNRPQVQTVLTSASLAHVLWASQIQEHLLNGKTTKLTVNTDGKTCAFGKWFYGNDRANVEKEYPDLVPIFNELDQLHLDVHASALGIQKELDVNNIQAAKDIFNNKTSPVVEKVVKLLSEAITVADKKSSSSLQEILDFATERALLIFVLGGMFFIAFPIFSYMIISSITRPINTLAVGAKRIAHGEFVPVELDQKDEMGQLATSFNQMVKDLKENLGLAQALMNGITMPCIICGTDGKVIFVNTMFLECWHEPRSPEECLGETAGSVLYGIPERHTRLDTIIEGGTSVRDRQVHVVLRDGQEKFFNVNAAPLRNMDGELVGAVALYSDLSEMYEQQLQIEKLNDSIYLSANDANKISNKQTAELEKLVEQLENTSHMAEQQAQSSQASTASLQQITESMRQMANEAISTQDAANSASNEADSGMDIITQTIECIDQVTEHTAAVANDMKELDASAENIGRILNLIKDIADQTNLLALNAAIEAARAGDAGRGFAVVADEVRKLAEKTMEATNEVASAVGSIQSSVRNSVSSTNTSVELTQKSTELAKKSGESLQRIREVTHNSVVSAQSISEATVAQSRESEAALQMLEEINEQADQTQQNMDISTQFASTLQELSVDLRAIINKMCDERRSCARYTFTEDTSVRWDSEEFGNGMTTIVNISNDGMCLQTGTLPKDIPVGSTITIHTVGGPLSTVFSALAAKICWIVAEKGVGLEFLQTQAVTKLDVEGILKRLPSTNPNVIKKKKPAESTDN